MIASTFLRRTLGMVVLLALVCSIPALALEKVGTTSMQVLKIPVGVRGIGLGNAMVGAAENAEAVWWNPGALTEVKKNDVQISQINLPADIQLNSLVWAHRLGDYQAIALQAINLFTDDMPIRTWERPQGTGENFNASDLAIGLGYARKLTDRFSLGGNVRYLRSALEEEEYNGVSVDLGTLYKTGLRSLRLGMAIQNLGPDVEYSGTFLDYRNQTENDNQLLERSYEGASLPTMFRLGVVFDLFEMLAWTHNEDHDVHIAVEMNHPNDNRERLNLGGEYDWRDRLYLRAGGKFAYDEESFALGFGLYLPLADHYRFKFDYAYSHWGLLSEAADGFMAQPHRFGLGFEW